MRKLILAVALLAIAAAAAAAETTPLQEYTRQMAAAQRNIDLAQLATQCGLRSQRWFEVFPDAYQLLATTEARRFGLGSVGLDASDAMSDRITREVMASNTCQSLANSKTMKKLDHIHDVLTAGFQ